MILYRKHAEVSKPTVFQRSSVVNLINHMTHNSMHKLNFSGTPELETSPLHIKIFSTPVAEKIRPAEVLTTAVVNANCKRP